MNPLATLKDEIVAFNTELNTVQEAITNIPKLSFVKALLQKKALEALASGSLEAKLFEKFSDAVEAQAEAPTEKNPFLNNEDKNDPFSSIESSSYVSPSSVIIDKEEFLEEIAKIYSDEIEGTINENQNNEYYQEDAEDQQKPEEGSVSSVPVKQESFALNIVLNENQLHAKEMALAGKSYVLIGAAGTGKTTAQRSVAEALLQDSRLSSSTFKTYTADGTRAYKNGPSIAFCAYTRRAASNLRKAIHKSPLLAKELTHNILTIHALLEYEPETYWDPTENKDKFRFAPKRNAQNPLDITHLIIEEASMVGAHDLWMRLYEALPVGVQIIFIGDINQLTPVFGPSILNYALVNLPVVELTKVYRNQGVVLENAHNILAGREIIEDANYRVVEPLYTDKKGKRVQAGQEKLSYMMRAFFESLSEKMDADGEPEYDPEDCMILSPWNKQAAGTDNLNKHMAQFLGSKRNAVVHEVLAGRNKVYIALGDKVMYNKRDGVVTDILKNSAYFGRSPQLPGTDLSRFGVRVLGAESSHLDDVMIDYSSFSLEALEEEKAERKQQASHVVRITYDDGTWDDISATGEFDSKIFSLGYVLTVHKAQGSEWRKVFILLHKDFAVSLHRELFYTAATRARTKVTIIALRETIAKAIKNQRIKGDSLKDKLEYFNSGAALDDNVPILK